MNELKIVNRGKIAYLYMHDCFEQDIELIERNGKTQYAFVYEATDKVLSLLKEFDESNNLKKYNSCFKHVALAIKRKNMEDSDRIEGITDKALKDYDYILRDLSNK